MPSLGLYLHIPFCRSKCLYCDFCSFPRPNDKTVEAYVAALTRDLVARAEEARGYTVDTVYFGGGTPTCLAGETLASLLEGIKTHYHVADDAEITAECNPATASLEKLRVMRAAGFNRLSIGLQSIHTGELRALGRIHSLADFEATLSDARAAGFSNLSADVMFGIPEQTGESWQETLGYLCDRGLSHISAYGLIVEEGTPFAARKDALVLPDEETVRKMYLSGIELLASRGYAQYEISNFARRGCESRHNLRYWNTEEFLGFGPSAYSDFGGARFGNSRDLLAYTEGRDCTAEYESISREERKNEYVMLRMRLVEGISAAAYEARFGEPFSESYGRRLEAYLSTGLVKRMGDGYAFTPEGMYVSNAILSEILDF